jgi:ppGpp synthetase/RelA/SpoT-type nucleotidyltranferase
MRISLDAVEETLLPFRVARRYILNHLLPLLLQDGAIADPFLLATRFFVRLKSADSILEKVARKGIALSNVTEIPQKMTDILGFRVIASDINELNNLDRLLTSNFEVVSRESSIHRPDEIGRREISYQFLFHDGASSYLFELQLRTFLQHYWASRSFHLLHKQPKEVSRNYASVLSALGEALERAEDTATNLPSPDKTRAGDISAARSRLCDRINLVVVEPGELFANHVVLSLSGDDRRDHKNVIREKMALYADFPGAALVECSCLSFFSFTLNEPHVRVPIDRLDKVTI